jgi:hypothetical protein
MESRELSSKLEVEETKKPLFFSGFLVQIVGCVVFISIRLIPPELGRIVASL